MRFRTTGRTTDSSPRGIPSPDSGGRGQAHGHFSNLCNLTVTYTVTYAFCKLLKLKDSGAARAR